jgi:hypothetical protein
MINSNIRIQLDSESRSYQPGQKLAGRFFVDDLRQPVVRTAELSVLWYTSGKGDEDFEVHHFQRIAGEGGMSLDLRTPRKFQLELPASPLSYDGVILKVCWCVRLRLFLQRGQEIVGEVPFRLGNVRPGADVP